MQGPGVQGDKTRDTFQIEGKYIFAAQDGAYSISPPTFEMLPTFIDIFDSLKFALSAAQFKPFLQR